MKNLIIRLKLYWLIFWHGLTDKVFSTFYPSYHPHDPVVTFKPEKPKDGYLPEPGFKWNPVLKYPKNEACYCGSGVKFKKCCLPNESMAVNPTYADAAVGLVKTMRAVKKRA